MKPAYSAIKVTESQFKPLHDTILVKDMNFEERKIGSIIIVKDDGKNSGIRPRWAEVYAVGPEQNDVQVGQFICVEHGRWTRGVEIEDETGRHTIRKVDPKDIMLVSDERVDDATMSDKV